MTFYVGNAPCSWGTIENTEGERQIGYSQMLDELAATGYVGTELGDLGFMPTDPEKLRDELTKRQLQLTGSWVTVRLYDEAFHDRGVARAVEVAKLLRAVGGEHCTINIGDDHSTVPARHNNTGRITQAQALDSAGWDVYVRGATAVAKAVKEETGLRSVLHPHGSTFVETPAEIDIFLDRTDPELLGIVFDTGHFMLGGGDPVKGIKTYADRIWLMHLKDFKPEVVTKAVQQGWNYQQMIGEGLFSRLGEGAVDFQAVLAVLREVQYQGWLVVEQDVLPGMGSPKDNALHNREYLRTLGL